MRAEDDAAFDAFVRASSPALLRTATLLAGNEDRGRDLLQSALVKALPRWRSIDNPTAYVRRAMATTVIDWGRKRRFAELPLDAAAHHPAREPADLAEREAALALLRNLPPAQRAVLVLRFFDDLTEQATADALGVSLGTVKSATSRGLAALRRATQEVEP